MVRVVAGTVLIAAAIGLLAQDRTRTLAAGDGAARVRGHRIRGDLGSALCVAGGLLAAVAFANEFGYGRGQFVALLPTLVGVCLLAIFTLLEATWPRPAGAVRTASVRARTLKDLAVAWRPGLLIVWAALLVIAATALAIVASGPRSVSRTLAGGQVVTVSPFPGWWFGLPVVLGTLLLLAWAWALVRIILSRPAVADLDDDQDLALRRQSAKRVLGGTQLAMALSLVGLLVSAGWALRRLGLDQFGSGLVSLTAPISITHIRTGTVLFVMAGVVLLSSLVGVFAGRPRRRRKRKSSVASAVQAGE